MPEHDPEKIANPMEEAVSAAINKMEEGGYEKVMSVLMVQGEEPDTGETVRSMIGANFSDYNYMLDFIQDVLEKWVMMISGGSDNLPSDN